MPHGIRLLHYNEGIYVKEGTSIHILLCGLLELGNFNIYTSMSFDEIMSKDVIETN